MSIQQPFRWKPLLFYRPKASIRFSLGHAETKQFGEDGKYTAMDRPAAIFCDVALGKGEDSREVDWDSKNTFKLGALDVIRIIRGLNSGLVKTVGDEGNYVSLIHTFKDTTSTFKIDAAKPFKGENGVWVTIQKGDDRKSAVMNEEEVAILLLCLKQSMLKLVGWEL